MSTPAIDDLIFRYTALDRQGRRVRDVIRARDERGAARALAADGLTTLSLRPETTRGPASLKARDFNFAERVSVLRQIALMVQAGVNILETLETVAAGATAVKGRASLEAVIGALKRGEPFAAALSEHAPGFPFYVYAMSRVGEATGHLGEVLDEAAEQMAYEHKLRREFLGALYYPAFLMAAGFAAVAFLLTRVVPVFAQMAGDNPDLPLISKVVFRAGALAQTQFVPIAIALGLIVMGIVLAVANPKVRAGAYRLIHRAPILGGILKAREVAGWARLIGFALKSGVLLLDAAALARQGAPEGPFRDGLQTFERDLKAGVDVDVSLGRHTRLEAMDLALLRAGQKSGQLPRMFLYVAERYDALLKDRLQRVTAMVEPATIGVVALFVALLAVSIMLSLTSVYESIS